MMTSHQEVPLMQVRTALCWLKYKMDYRSGDWASNLTNFFLCSPFPDFTLNSDGQSQASDSGEWLYVCCLILL